jgi:hypothetical protein
LNANAELLVPRLEAAFGRLGPLAEVASDGA